MNISVVKVERTKFSQLTQQSYWSLVGLLPVARKLQMTKVLDSTLDVTAANRQLALAVLSAFDQIGYNC